MGSVLSYALTTLDIDADADADADAEACGSGPAQSDMRLASREVCDDETWANTVLNRSSCSVQERLSELEARVDAWLLVADDGSTSSGSESDDEAPPTRRRAARRRSIEFAQTDMVRVFTVEASDRREAQVRPVEDDEYGGLLIDFDPW